MASWLLLGAWIRRRIVLSSRLSMIMKKLVLESFQEAIKWNLIEMRAKVQKKSSKCKYWLNKTLSRQKLMNKELWEEV